MDCEELRQEVIKLTRSSATKSDVTYALCKQGALVTGELTDAEIIEIATNAGDGKDYGDEPPREVPTSAGMRNFLRLL